jgi:hypothetical protein
MVYHNDELWVLAFGSNKIQIFSDPVATGNGSWFDSPWAGFLSLRLPGGGPAGIVMQDYRDRAYVYSRYDHQLSVISSTNKFVINTIDLFSPEPASVKQGRPFLYDAELTSSNGTGSCLCY